MAKRVKRADVVGQVDSAVNDVHVLDVGPDPYGDCILCRIGGKTILIDGAHQGDDKAVNFENITTQLTALIGPPPFEVDLLVVTHGHLDHTGCLPSLIKAGNLLATDALVADPESGWGMPESVDAPTGRRGRLMMALREERYLSDDLRDVGAFLDAAGTLFDRYVAMLAKLNERGTNVVRYRRDNRTKVDALVARYAAAGLELLGPTYDHLEKCAALIAQMGRGAGDAVDAILDGGLDASASEVDAYLALLRTFDATNSVSAAINDQSLVLAVGKTGRRVLLTGDMQFGEWEVEGLDADIEALVGRIEAAGPYVMVKLAHHGSQNATSVAMLEAVGATQFFAISTGSKSDKHPYLSTLALLEAHGQRIGKPVQWARTDRNGQVYVTLGSPIRVYKSRNSFNDETPPADYDALLNVPPNEPAREPAEPANTGSTEERTAGTVQLARDGDVVEVTATIPHASTRVTITIDVEPRGGAAPSEPRRGGGGGSRGSGGGEDARLMPGVLVLTDERRLVANTDRATARAAIAALEARGATLLTNFPAGSSEAARIAFARDAVVRHGAKGLLLLGGYDVVPPVAVDSLDEPLRAALGGTTNDPDDFVVWSDDPYADADESAVPDVPVSRLPDGRSPAILTSAFGPAARAAGGKAYLLRNHFRPFAAEVLAATDRVAEVSHPLTATTLQQARLSAGRVYFMLHGDDADGTRFWGETPSNGALEAVNADQVEGLTPGTVVFAGCCWGALAGERPAARSPVGVVPAGRTPEGSIALRCLASGAAAFVGTTGAHYSPVEPPYNYFGGPMHVDFWRALATTGQPAVALFEAKTSYLDAFPHGRQRPLERAIERKILRQFTCLGVGW